MVARPIELIPIVLMLVAGVFGILLPYRLNVLARVMTRYYESRINKDLRQPPPEYSGGIACIQWTQFLLDSLASVAGDHGAVSWFPAAHRARRQ
jgi:hypothetical protein